MITVLIALLTGLACGVFLAYGNTASPAWSVFWGALFAVFSYFALGWIVRRRVQAEMERVEGILRGGQQRMQQKMAKWQIRPPGSVKQAQKELEREQNVFIAKALDASASLEKYRPWSLMLNRQLATLRMQLNYQRQNFEEVDRLMPKCLFLDPMTMAMKLARMYARKADSADMVAYFRKASRRIRPGQGALLYAVISWILVQRGQLDEAHKILIKGCERIDNEILQRNRDHLANNRLKQFSNAGFGDEWYALGLEKPKIRTKRQKAPPGRFF